MIFSQAHKNKLIKGLLLLFLISLLMFPSACFRGASTGLLLWFHNILPNLLPFIIISNLMVSLNLTRQISKVFYPFFKRLFHVSCEGCYPIIIGFLSGIPMGAKSTGDLVSQRRITKNEGQFLVAMCNNASPMFIIGYIAITQLKLPHIKYALFLIIYGSAIIAALLYRLFCDSRSKAIVYEHEDQKLPQNTPATNRFTFELLDASIMNGFEVITKIGGYIILFSILAQIIHEATPDTGIYKAVIMGILEITTGINQICNTKLDNSTKIVLITALTSFGGFSGIAQTKSVLGDSRLSIKSYIITKLISAVLALALAVLYVLLFQIA